MKKLVVMMALLLVVALLSNIACAAGDNSKNLLVNGDFETIGTDQTPGNWRADFWQPGSTLDVTTKKAHQGKYALEIVSAQTPNDARMLQTVPVKPNTYYKFSGWMATENVTPQKIGANLCVMSNTFTNSSSLNDTIDWTYMEYNFKTTSKQSEVTVGPRLGMWGNDVTGAAYFDDLSLVELNSAPANFQTLQEPPAQSSPSAKTTAKLSFPNIGLIIVFILIVLVIVFVVYRRMKQSKKDVKDVNETGDINEMEAAEETEAAEDKEDTGDLKEEGENNGNEEQES